MASGHVGQAIRGLERLWRSGSLTGVSEVQLLERFIARRDDAAFEALVARHGAMVLAVCRQWLRDSHDVEDAFQATFLVLVRKASSLRGELLGNWLYGVAYRVANRARCDGARRRTKEQASLDEVVDGRGSDSPDPCSWVHDEVHRLPEKYRAPIVLCYLEGLTHEQAAEQLHWPLGTVKGRLSRARELLKSRLARRGLAPSVGTLLVLFSPDARAAVPPALVDRTISASCAAAGHAMAAGTISARAAALTKGVCHAMFLSKLKVASAFLALAALVTTGAGVVANQAGAPAPEKPTGAPEAPATHPSTADPEPKPEPEGAPGVSADPPVAPGNSEVEIARQALATMEAQRKQGQAVGSEQFYAWSDRLLQAEQRVARTPADRLAAAEAHRARMKQALDQATAAYRQGRVALLHMLDLQYRYEQANLAVTKENAGSDPAMGGLPTSLPAQVKPGPAMSMMSAGMSGGGMAGPGGMMKGGGRAGAMAGAPPMNGALRSFAAGGFGRGIGEQMNRVTLARLTAMVEARDTSPQSRATRKKLEAPVAMSFANGAPLSDVLKYIKSATTEGHDNGLQIYVDPVGLQEANATLKSVVTLDLDGIPLRTTLKLALKQHGLAYCVKDGLLMISTVEAICRELEEAATAQSMETSAAEPADAIGIQ